MTYSNLVDATGLEYFFDLIYLKYLQFIGTSVQQEAGKGLSSNDYTTTEKNKLSGIASGAQVNVIEAVKVNGSALTITDKAVDIPVPTNYLTASDITDMATKTWVGQQNYLTSHQSLSGYATETWVNSKLNDILGVNADAVSSLIAVLSDSDAQTGILNMIAGKADSSSLATVATSGSYNDLTNKPTLFSGSYDDLTNKPTIPSAYTLPIASSSVLGGVKIGTGLSINSETGVLSATVQDISGKANISDLSTVAFSGSYNDLLNKPTLADAQVQADWTESNSVSKAYILHKPSIYTQTEVDTMLANVPFMADDDGEALVADGYVSVTDAVVIVSSNSVPTSSTTQYTDAFSQTRTYKVGDQIKVYNSADQKYDIYVLYNLSNGVATWEQSGTSYDDSFDTYTVVISSNVGANDTGISNATVTIGTAVLHNGDTLKVPKVDVLPTPIMSVIPGYFAEEISVNNYTITAYYMKNGAYIFERKGGLYTASEWTSAKLNNDVSDDDVIGIALFADENRVVISPYNLDITKKMYGSLTAADGMVGITNLNSAEARFDGYTDTSSIMNAYSTTAKYAAGAARHYNFNNGVEGYLPSLGEFTAAYTNKSTIDALITACNKDAINIDAHHYTSTYYGPYGDYIRFWTKSWDDGSLDGNISGDLYVRPFAKWKPITTKLHFIATDNSSVAKIMLWVTDSDGNSHYVKTGNDGDVYLSLDNGTYTVGSFSHSLSIDTFTVSGLNTNINISATYHQYVDLGLTSGLKWAIGNIHRASDGSYSMGKPDQPGAYFSWANIDGHNDADGYNDLYVFILGNYNNTSGKNASANIGSTSDYDAAYKRLGSPWRLPTNTEFAHLKNGSDIRYIYIDKCGYGVLSSKQNANKLLLPAIGAYVSSGSIINKGAGFYYSSSISTSDSTCSYDYNFDPDENFHVNGYSRFCGFYIRAVQ